MTKPAFTFLKISLSVSSLILGTIFLLTLLRSDTAPNSIFTSITGKKILLQQLQGKVVLVNFWASDCPACIEEIPFFLDLYRQYHKSGLEIIAVAMAHDPPSHVVAMTKAKQLPYDVVLDLQSTHARAFGNVQLTPSSFLINPDGHFVMKKIGLLDATETKNLIEKYLKG